MKLLFLSLIVLALAGGCSKGTTTESTSGANDVPVVNANSSHGGQGALSNPDSLVGTYYGYIARTDGTFVPLNVDLETKLSSTGGPADLRINMQVGLFGGVQIGTDTVDFDWTTGLLSASFSNGSDIFELIGHVENGVIVGATVNGARSGTQTAVLSRTGQNLFPQDNADTHYKLTFPSTGVTGTKGVLTISSQLQALASGSSSDLPMIPNLASNFNFPWGASPVDAQSVIYDPLTAQVDFMLEGGNRVHFSGVALKDLNGETVPSTLSGAIFAGSFQTATVEADLSTGGGNAKPTNQGVGVGAGILYFTGTFTGLQSFLKYDAVGSLQYLGSQGKNPPEISFPSFPNMQLSVTVCLHGQGIGPMEFQATSMDPVRSKVLFEEDRTTQKVDFQATYTSNFSTLTGTIEALNSSQGAGGQSSTLTLRASSNTVPPSCENTK